MFLGHPYDMFASRSYRDELKKSIFVIPMDVVIDSIMNFKDLRSYLATAILW